MTRGDKDKLFSRFVPLISLPTQQDCVLPVATYKKLRINILLSGLEASFATMKIERRRWPEIPLILGRSGAQYVATVTKILSSYFGARLVESYCKESNISDKNWLRYIFFHHI